MKQKHINGIENFWNQAKRVLKKYAGLKSVTVQAKFEKDGKMINKSYIWKAETNQRAIKEITHKE